MKKILKNLSTFLCVCLTFLLISCNAKEDKEETTLETTTVVEEVTETSIEETEEVEETIQFTAIEPLEVKGIDGYRNSDKSIYVEIEFSKEIKDGFDAKPYIKITPECNYTISKVGNKLILTGDFNASNVYNVSVLEGVVAKDNGKTLSETTREVAFEQKMPKIMFTNEGIILPSVNEKRIYIRTLNVNKVKIKVKKIYANNFTQFLHDFRFDGNGTFYGNFSNVGDVLHEVTYDIENEIDAWVQTAIDLSGVLDKNGIYIVDASFDRNGTSYKTIDDDYDYYDYLRENGFISKSILLTDMGILASKSNDGIKVNVVDIVDNSFMRGAKVYLMSKNNQILEEKTTNAEGVVDFGNHKNSYYILADNVYSKSILPLDNELSKNGFSVAGKTINNSIAGYIYTERGVYRPGDPVFLSLIARNNGEPLDDNQPVSISVYDPTGAKIIENDVIKNGIQGFYTYTFETDLSARTGIWKLEATIGHTVLKKDISVETVVPNRISVSINIPEEANVSDGFSNWSISSNYLFGEPAKNLNYSVSFDIREEPINFKDYKEYTFKEPSSYGYSDYKSLSGALDGNGIDTLRPDFDDISFGSLNMLIDVEGRVVDEGGRSVTTKKYLKLKKFDTYIGIENTKTYKKPGSKLDLKVICVTEDGKNLVAGKKLKYKIYGNNNYWWWDYSSYSSYVRSFKSDKDTVLLTEGNIVTKDVPVLLDCVLPEAEYLYVELIDETTGQVTGVNLLASEWVDLSVTKKVETLNIISDKKTYNVGDTAMVQFKGTKNSKAIITVEKSGKIINQFYRDIDTEEVTEEIPITKDMTPNVYVYVTLLQDYKTKDNDRPLRLYGILPINVVDEDTKIDLVIEAPDQIRPNETFSVKVKNNKFKKVNFTVAVVDEGLLDITQFATPSPWGYFFQKLAANISLYDNFSQIIDRPYGAINQILKVGGDAALLDEMARRRRLKELGLEEADRFTPVSMYQGVLTTNEYGEASVDFKMPNYMGQVRIMVVAAEGNSYGSAEKNMLVKAPLIINPTLPRTMKVGDKMSIPVTVFAIEENINDIEVYYTFDGKTQNKPLVMKKGDQKTIYFDQEIGNEVGSKELTVGVKSNVYNYEETVGMAINSNYSPIRINENFLLNKNQSKNISNDSEFVKGTVNLGVTISNREMLGLDQRLEYLIQYPYGCAEQTTSSIFPQLFINNLATTKVYDKDRIVRNINIGIERLKLFQLPNGSFSYWPGGSSTSDWATNYVGHFLISAKKEGYYVPNEMYNKWIDYTFRNVKKISIESSHDIDFKCYSLFLLALANEPNISEMNYMYENCFKDMTDTTKMYLAAAYKLSGEEKIAKKIASSINTLSVKSLVEKILKRDKYYYEYSYGSKLREIAVYLDCYYIIYGKVDDEAFYEILNSLRNRNWYSSQTTSYCLLALSNAVSGNKNTNVKGIIEVDGTKQEFDALNEHKLILDSAAKSVKITSNCDDPIYINYFLEGVPINDETPEYSDGFSLKRIFYNNDGVVIDPTNLKSGDAFWLEVQVNTTDDYEGRVKNIAINQILPTGWEIENLRVNNTKPPAWVEESSKNTIVTYTDIRDDRIMWFFDSNHDEQYRFFVKLNAVTKGEFDFPGTTLEAMYDYNYKALLKGGKVKVN